MQILVFNVLFLSCCAFSSYANAAEDKEAYTFDIPSLKAEEALGQLAVQTGRQLLFSYELVDSFNSSSVSGEYTVKSALDLLLQGTGLSGSLTERGVILVTSLDARNNTQPGRENMKTNKNKLSIGVFATLAAFFGGAEGITAQENASSASDGVVLEELIVKGIRGSIQRAQELKRNANAVVDAITADDLGKFSDEAISDSIQRIPGVQVERNDGGQEGDRVSIRGLGPTYVVTTVNGRTALSSGTEGLSNLRSFNLEVIPTDIISGVVVKKTPTASDVESGLAGLVELKTRRPLESSQYQGNRDFFGSLTLQGDEGSIGHETGNRYSGIFGARNSAGTLGFYAAYLDAESFPGRDQLFPTVVQRDLQLDDDGDGIADRIAEDVFTIQAIDFEPIRETRLRESFAGAVQWQPTDTLDIIADITYTSYDNASIRNRIAPAFNSVLDNSVLDSSLITIDSTNTLQAVQQGGFLPGENVVVQFIPFLFGNKTESLVSGLNFDFQPSESLTIKADFHYSKVDYIQDLDLPIGLQNIPAEQVSFNTDNGLFTAGFGSPLALDGFNFPLDLVLVRDVFMEGDQLGFKFDFEQKLHHNFFDSIEYGVRWTRDDVDSIRTDIISVPGDLTQQALNDIAIAGINQTTTSNFGFYPGEGIFNDFPVGDFNLFCDRIDDLCRVNDIAASPATTFAFSEDVLAFYAESNVKGEIAGKSFTGNFGLRLVNVRFNGEGARVEPDKSITPTSTSNEYWEGLPSGNFNIELNEDLTWRLAFAKVMSRPNPSDLVPREAANPTSNIGDIPTGQRGNAGLNPTTSWNFDTTFEYYTESDGAFVVSLFYKKVKDFVFPITTQSTLPGQGSQIFDVRTPENFAGGDVKGFEVGFNQPFAFLPEPLDGFGLQANYTYANSSFDRGDVGDNGFGFPGSSKNNFNSILYYEKGGFGTRLSYIFRDDYFRNLPGQGAQAENSSAVFTEGDSRVNVNASYDINDNISVFVDVNNLTEEGRRDFFLQKDTFNGAFRRERTTTIGITARM